MLTPSDFAEYLSAWQSSPWLPLVIIACFVLGSAVFFPITALIIGTAYLLPPIEGALVSFVGIAAAGMIGFSVGRYFGAKAFRKPRLAAILQKVKSKVTGNEIISVAVMRKLPLGPFSLVNMALGACKLNPLYFTIGCVLGLSPIVILAAVFKHSYTADGGTSWSMFFTAALVLSGALLLGYVLQRVLPGASKKNVGPH